MASSARAVSSSPHPPPSIPAADPEPTPTPTAGHPSPHLGAEPHLVGMSVELAPLAYGVRLRLVAAHGVAAQRILARLRTGTLGTLAPRQPQRRATAHPLDSTLAFGATSTSGGESGASGHRDGGQGDEGLHAHAEGSMWRHRETNERRRCEKAAAARLMRPGSAGWLIYRPAFRAIGDNGVISAGQALPMDVDGDHGVEAAAADAGAATTGTGPAGGGRSGRPGGGSRLS